MMDTEISEIVEQVAKDLNIAEHGFSVLSGLGTGDNYMGSLLRIEISGKTKDKDVTQNIIFKLSPKSKIIRGRIPVAQYYQREIYSYETMLSTLEKLQNDYNLPEEEKFNFIKCYKTGRTEPNEYVVMEDLTVAGYKLCVRKKPLDYDHMNLAIRNIAYYHSLSFALRKYKPELYNELAADVAKDFFNVEGHKIFVDTTVKTSLSYVRNPEYRKKLEVYAEKQYDISCRCTKPETCYPYNVFCHGDFWQNNILFKYTDGMPTDLRLVDWQMVKNCSPIVDISHLIFSATDDSLRKDHYEELLDLYYQTLTTSLAKLDCDINQCYPRHIFEKQLQDILPYGFTYSMISLILQMRGEEEVINIEEVIKKHDSNYEIDFKFTNQDSVNDFTDRIEGVVCDMIRLGVI